MLRYRRPGLVRAIGRGAVVLLLLGVGLVGTAVITGLTLGMELPLAAAIATGAASCAVNTLIAVGLFRLLVSRRLTVGQLLPGAIVVGAGSYTLTLAGGLYVQRIVANASSLYGSFATMVGLFAWIALLVQTVVYGTLVNVVRVEQLWPRSITRCDLGGGDQRAAELSAARAALLDVRCRPPDHRERETPETVDSSHHVPDPAGESAPIRAVLGIDRC